ncbi:hypothetical protein Aperf_G00000006626 [Anoplocephala perfoliata]
MGDSGAGEKLLDATEKITDTLSSYFCQKLNKSCRKLRDIDPEWFDKMASESVNEFKHKSMSQIANLIKTMQVSEKAAIIEEANKMCIVKRPWRPSGNPEKDTYAHIYEMQKEYRDLLVSESQSLYRYLKTKSSELKAARRAEIRSLESLEEIAKYFKDV